MQFDKNCFVYLFLFPNQYVHCFYCPASASSLIDLPAAFLATLVQLKPSHLVKHTSNFSLIQ